MGNNVVKASLRTADLIYKFKAGTLTPAERQDLDKLLAEDSSLKRIFDSIDDREQVYQDLELMNSFDPELTIGNYHTQYFMPGKSVRLWPRIGIAAAIAAMLVSAALFFYFNQNNINETDALVTNVVSPGKERATLTLADGKKVRLTQAANKVLAKEAGVTIYKSENGELIYEIKGSGDGKGKFNTLTTARGETYRIRLPDGSMVWLNAASSLIYPVNLVDNGIRKVKLQGEGYFEIAKDKEHPFIVESRGQEVEVLGTHFNVQAYPEEPTSQTTLLEGAVKVSSGNGSRIIKPGQQAKLSGVSIRVEEVDTELAVAWKDNQFLFENQDLASIMRMISRWYNVDVNYTDDVMNEKFGGGLSRFDHVSKVLKSLEGTGSVHFKLQGRTIYVSK